MIERTQFWTKRDFELFISSFEDYEYVVFFTLIFISGLSSTETRGLRKEDFDFDRRIVNVRRGFIRRTKTNKEVLIERKTQTYELTGDVINLVREYIKSISTDFLFSISRFEVSEILYFKCKQQGIKRIILHGNHNKNMRYVIE